MTSRDSPRPRDRFLNNEECRPQTSRWVSFTSTKTNRMPTYKGSSKAKVCAFKVCVQCLQCALLSLQLGLNGKTKVRTFRKCHSFRLLPLSGLFGRRGLGLLSVTGGNGIMNRHGSKALLCLKARRQPEQRGGTLLWLGSHYRQSKQAGGLEIVTVK